MIRDWRTKIQDLRIRKILERVVPRLERMPDVYCIFLRSSYALGVGTPQSDIDIGVINKGEPRMEIWAEYEIPVHVHFSGTKIMEIIEKDEKDPELLPYIPLLKSLSNIIPLSDKEGISSVLQAAAIKKKLLFVKFHLDEMGKQLNDAHGFFQKGAYDDTILNIRKATTEGILAFLSMIGMPGANDKYAFTLLSSPIIGNARFRGKAREISQLVRKIHNLEGSNQEMAANYFLHAWHIFEELHTMLETYER